MNPAETSFEMLAIRVFANQPLLSKGFVNIFLMLFETGTTHQRIPNLAQIPLLCHVASQTDTHCSDKGRNYNDDPSDRKEEGTRAFDRRFSLDSSLAHSFMTESSLHSFQDSDLE